MTWSLLSAVTPTLAAVETRQGSGLGHTPSLRDAFGHFVTAHPGGFAVVLFPASEVLRVSLGAKAGSERSVPHRASVRLWMVVRDVVANAVAGNGLLGSHGLVPFFIAKANALSNAFHDARS